LHNPGVNEPQTNIKSDTWNGFGCYPGCQFSYETEGRTTNLMKVLINRNPNKSLNNF
jgi:hypothetical protein